MTTSDRVLSVLELFDEAHSSWSVEEAADHLRLAVPTTYRYFRTLTQSGLLYAYMSGRYVLGPGIVKLDRLMRVHDPLIAVAQPQMDNLARNCGRDCVVLLARLYNEHVMCVRQAYFRRPPFAVSYERGRLMPLDRGATSKVILAYADARLIRALKTPRSDSGFPAIEMTPTLKANLRAIRKNGYAVTEGELDEGMRGLAVPLFQPDLIISGSLSVVMSNNVPLEDRIIENIILARKEIETELALRVAGIEKFTRART